VKNNTTKLAIRTNFSNLQMQEGTNVGDFLTEVQVLINNLGDVEERPSGTMIVEQVFSVLPPSFDSFITNISGAPDKPTFDDLAVRLELWEPRTKNKTKHEGEEASVVEFRKMFRSRKFQNNAHINTTGKNSISRTKQGYCGHDCRK